MENLKNLIVDRLNAEGGSCSITVKLLTEEIKNTSEMNKLTEILRELLINLQGDKYKKIRCLIMIGLNALNYGCLGIPAQSWFSVEVFREPSDREWAEQNILMMLQQSISSRQKLLLLAGIETTYIKNDISDESGFMYKLYDVVARDLDLYQAINIRKKYWKVLNDKKGTSANDILNNLNDYTQGVKNGKYIDYQLGHIFAIYALIIRKELNFLKNSFKEITKQRDALRKQKKKKKLNKLNFNRLEKEYVNESTQLSEDMYKYMKKSIKSGSQLGAELVDMLKFKPKNADRLKQMIS